MNNHTELLGLARYEVRRRTLSRKTENAYLNHIRRFLDFCAGGDLSVGRADKISRFLAQLKKTRAVSTQNQARSALLFFYRDVLRQKISESFKRIEHARPKITTREVFTHSEIKAVLANLHGANFLVAALMYGSGLRLPEAVRLRVRDIDFREKEIKVCNVQTCAIERRTVLPASLENHLKRHLRQVKYKHEDAYLSDSGENFPSDSVLRSVHLSPEVFAWQYLFPAVKLSPTRSVRSSFLHHIAESTVQKAVAEAVEKANIGTRGGCHTLRYSFALRLFEQRCDVHTICRLLGHKNLKTTMNYLETDGAATVRSPLD